MSTEITLSGDALTGVLPVDVPLRATFAALPVTVRLGRKPPVTAAPPLRFGAYFDPTRMAAAPPAAINRREKAAPALARMYLNDRYGCCVISGKAHALGVWGVNDGGPLVVATDDEVYAQYWSICGPGDNGCVITRVLDVMRGTGFLAGGKRYKIDGYVAVDWRNKLAVQVAQYVFGATTIGINLPQAWTSSAVWDVTDSPIVGGHDVTPIDYDEKGVYVSSWGRVYLMTWPAFTSVRWVEEYYALLAPLWYGADNLAPNGIDVTTLKADLAAFGGGKIPDVGPSPVTTLPPNPVTSTTTPPPPTTTYNVVSDTDVQRLRATLTDKRTKGWALQGGVSISHTPGGALVYAQALSREPA